MLLVERLVAFLLPTLGDLGKTEFKRWISGVGLKIDITILAYSRMVHHITLIKLRSRFDSWYANHKSECL